MRKRYSNGRRWVEVVLTSLCAVLMVWDSFPDGTPAARIGRAAVAAAVGPLLVFLRHGHRDPKLKAVPKVKR